MKVIRVETGDSEILRAILSIHDRMPREWDPTHASSEEFVQKLVTEIQASSEPQGFWVLSDSETLDRDRIQGILWAGIKVTGRDHLSCAIKSLWVQPSLRGKNFTRLLSEACLAWAKTAGATRLVCSTHFANQRMRRILEANRFEPGMIEYVLRV